MSRRLKNGKFVKLNYIACPLSSCYQLANHKAQNTLVLRCFGCLFKYYILIINISYFSRLWNSLVVVLVRPAVAPPYNILLVLVIV